MKRYNQKQTAIKTLFDFEESNNIPASERLTFDPYADIPAIPEPSPRKKPYVDIRIVECRVRDLKTQCKLYNDNYDSDPLTHSYEDDEVDNGGITKAVALALIGLASYGIYKAVPHIKDWWSNKSKKI